MRALWIGLVTAAFTQLVVFAEAVPPSSPTIPGRQRRDPRIFGAAGASQTCTSSSSDRLRWLK